MEDLLHHGWAAKGVRSYAHYCGAKVVQRAKQSWTAKKVDGTLSFGHESAEQAIRWIEAHDQGYWTYGACCSMGSMAAHIGVTAGFLDTDEDKDLRERDHVVVLSLYKTREFPRQNEASFKRLFLSNARCARCDRQSTEIILRSLPEEGTSTRRRTLYVVCSCGYPVWRITWKAFSDAEFGLRRAEYSRESKKLRKMSLRAAGGEHHFTEIEQILALQGNRCVYCNVEFSDRIRPTKDHLTPVLFGGTDWAANIVMACRSCNTRRGTIPFRTYCRSLSPTQNRRILRYLGRRVAAMWPYGLAKDEYESFRDGIARHNPKDGYYRLKLRSSARARRYAATNELLPRTPDLILKKADLL